MNDEELELEVERLRMRARFEELVAELGVDDPPLDMRDDPAAAVPLLEHARESRGRLGTGWIISRWRARRTKPLPVWPAPMALEPEEPDPLTSVADIEGGLRWARAHAAIIPPFVIPNLEQELEQALERERSSA